MGIIRQWRYIMRVLLVMAAVALTVFVVANEVSDMHDNMDDLGEWDMEGQGPTAAPTPSAAPTFATATVRVLSRDQQVAECLHGTDLRVAAACSSKLEKEQCIGAMRDWWCRVGEKPCNCADPVCTDTVDDDGNDIQECAEPVCTQDMCAVIVQGGADSTFDARFCWFDNSTVELGLCPNALLDNP